MANPISNAKQHMILGTYWYFDFPTGLYEFDFFKFYKGYGGHADNPAELSATFEAVRPEVIIEDLRKLIAQYAQGFLLVHHNAHQLKIATRAHHLFDYDFLLIEEVEKIVEKHGARPAPDKVLVKPTPIKLYGENSKNNISYPQHTFLQVVGSELKKHHAENLKLRVDCNLDLKHKKDFIEDVRSIAKEEGLDVFYYYDSEVKNTANLMLFFTNGRQGLNLKPKKYTGTVRFGNKLEQALMRHQAKAGFIAGYEHYPKNGPYIEMIIEQDMIL